MQVPREGSPSAEKFPVPCVPLFTSEPLFPNRKGVGKAVSRALSGNEAAFRAANIGGTASLQTPCEISHGAFFQWRFSLKNPPVLLGEDKKLL